MSLIHINAQETYIVTEDLSFDFSSAKFYVSESAKRERALLKGSGRIILSIDNPQDVSDEWKTSLKAACDVWSDYLEYGDSVIVNVVFTDKIKDDIRLSMTKNKYIFNGQDLLFPSALLRKITSEKFPVVYDAIVQINSKTNWSIGIGEENQLQPKKLTLAFMQCIGRILGFGSSVSLNKRGMVELGSNRIPTIFDYFIKNNAGQKITDYMNDRTALRKFSEGSMGKVYFSSQNQKAELYSPAHFENNVSLKYLSDTTALMGYPLKKYDMLIDDLTFNILNELGWNFSTNNGNVKIVTDDIDETGITSIYKEHHFYIEPKTFLFSSYNWKLILYDLKGNPVDVYSSHDSKFYIPELSNVDIYEHTIEGDIRGIIIFEGKYSGRVYKAAYPIIFEQKPKIISAKVVSINASENNPYYYDAIVEINYVGSHYIHSYVEEENSPYLTSYFSSTPYFTRLKLKNIESFGEAWLNITVKNEYGNDNMVLDLSVNDEFYASNMSGIWNGETNIASRTMGISRSTRKELYNLKGEYIGIFEDLNISNLKRGIYLIRQTTVDGNVIKTQKILLK